MKRSLPLIVLCLLLCACSPQQVQETTEPAILPAETQPVSLYAPGHPLETSALRVYPLPDAQVHRLLALGEGLLLISGSTRLTLLTGEDLTVTASMELPFALDPADPSLRVNENTVSYFDPVRRETVVLSGSLKEVGRIAAPEGQTGSPILSADRNTLYYCTPTAIRAWNLETGIRRCVKEMANPCLTGLHQSDSILQYRTSDGNSLFLAADTGRLLAEVPGDVTLHTHGSGFFASVPEGPVSLSLFGQTREDVRQLTPEDIHADCFYLQPQHQVLAVSPEGIVNAYDLQTGLHTASLRLSTGLTPLWITSTEPDAAYLLVQDAAGTASILRWDLQAQKTGDTRRYTGPRYTKASPDTTALAQCQAAARQIGEKYGMEVLVWEDPLSVAPWDYVFQPEYLAPVLERELSELDRRLSYYPPEILEGIREHFSGLTLCLVRQINGSPESGSLAQATGVQFFQDGHAYIAIGVGKYSERALYHELYHVMETRLLTDSAAFDRWDSMNPQGFSYDYDYAANAQRRAEEYLQPDSRSFIDTYSMSYPKEDRARIMECAMEDGNENLFRSPVMQAKLSCLSQAIREAYGLKKSPETFRWEQYLK